MKSSQEYPRAFGRRVAELHLDFMQSDTRLGMPKPRSWNPRNKLTGVSLIPFFLTEHLEVYLHYQCNIKYIYIYMYFMKICMT